MRDGPLAVLGMHRSGTSCLTGLLEQAGVFLGPVSRANPWNLKGNHENPAIMALHEAVLNANGGRWDAPPAAVVWPEHLKTVRDEIVRSYEGVPLWGFKDPRTLLLFEGWLEALPDLRFVGIVRHPELVAESLTRRSGLPRERGLRLWLSYNRRLLSVHRAREFPMISFDAARFEEAFARAAAALRLPSTSAGLDFFDPELRHAMPARPAPLPEEIERLYRALVERTV
jgi:hypothetical protein